MFTVITLILPKLAHALAVTTYEGEFSLRVGQGQLHWHPVPSGKSGRVGLRLFENFARWDGVWGGSGASAHAEVEKMLSKRVVACLDVRDGHLAKSIKFVNTQNIGDPVEKAREYYSTA